MIAYCPGSEENLHQQTQDSIFVAHRTNYGQMNTLEGPLGKNTMLDALFKNIVK